MIGLLAIPFVACVILVFVHVYFGAFVLRRGIIFIDLALAQWAALGYVIGHLLGVHAPGGLFLISFGFTVIAALILTLLKPLYTQVNLQEAVIGVVYITATALATGVISCVGMEGHHIADMLAGHLLFIPATELLVATIQYAIIAALLFFFHKHFLSAVGRAWDFLFYVLFGFVVTSSVKMVGVLLVFSYLVLPILSVILFSKQLKTQVLGAWGLGIIASLIGLGLSAVIDIPPSFSVIFVLCFVWGVSVVGCFVMKRKRSDTAKTALLLIDHGSRKREANHMLFELVKLMRTLKPGLLIYAAHMELAQPDIASGIRWCVTQGATQIKVVPYMLAPGRHVTQDIPRIVQSCMTEYPEISYIVTEPLGVHKDIASVIFERAKLDS